MIFEIIVVCLLCGLCILLSDIGDNLRLMAGIEHARRKEEKEDRLQKMEAEARERRRNQL